LSVYPTSTVASFSFLTPLFAIGLGHLIYHEQLSTGLIVAFVLVAAGIILINRKV
jgi:drug/metabolite transporter (DMT)-like permease